MTNKIKRRCEKCGISFPTYYLKEDVCNGCRNPELIVDAVVEEHRPGTGFRMLDEMIANEVLNHGSANNLKWLREALVKDLENEYQAGFAAGMRL